MGNDGWEVGDPVPDEVESALTDAFGVGGWTFAGYEEKIADISIFDRDDVLSTAEASIEGNLAVGETVVWIGVTWGGDVEDFESRGMLAAKAQVNIGTTIKWSDQCNGATPADCAEELKARMLDLGVEAMRRAMGAVELLVEDLSTPEAAVDVDETSLGKLEGVADRLAARYAHDPSAEDDRELAETVAGFLEGEKMTLQRNGVGRALFTGTGEPFADDEG